MCPKRRDMQVDAVNAPFDHKVAQMQSELLFELHPRHVLDGILDRLIELRLGLLQGMSLDLAETAELLSAAFARNDVLVPGAFAPSDGIAALTTVELDRDLIGHIASRVEGRAETRPLVPYFFVP
jgi:hypothetical protein